MHFIVYINYTLIFKMYMGKHIKVLKYNDWSISKHDMKINLYFVMTKMFFPGYFTFLIIQVLANIKIS